MTGSNDIVCIAGPYREMTGTEILNIKYLFRDVSEDVITISDYLKELLYTLISEGEGFSGKRPFGNSGWECDLASALVFGGAIKGEIESYDVGTEYEHSEACSYSFKDVREAMNKAIAAL